MKKFWRGFWKALRLFFVDTLRWMREHPVLLLVYAALYSVWICLLVVVYGR